MAATTKTERDEAIERLKGWIKPGDTLYTILRHRASSGMSRSISVIGISDERRIYDFDYNISRALGLKIDQTHGGLRMRGAGMDMGFEIVYNLGYCLFGDGYALKHQSL